MVAPPTGPLAEAAVVAYRSLGEAAAGATTIVWTYFGDAAPVQPLLHRLHVGVIGIDLAETEPDRIAPSGPPGDRPRLHRPAHHARRGPGRGGPDRGVAPRAGRPERAVARARGAARPPPHRGGGAEAPRPPGDEGAALPGGGRMTGPLFPSQEIGSLAKPRWQLLGQRGEPLDAAAVGEFPVVERPTPLRRRGPARGPRPLGGPPGRRRPRRGPGPWRAVRASVLRGRRPRPGSTTARRAGSRCTEYPIRQMGGFQFLGHVRSFDNKYLPEGRRTPPRSGSSSRTTSRSSTSSGATRRGSRSSRSRGRTPSPTGRTTSTTSARNPAGKGRAARRRAQREFVVEIARRAIRPTLAALIEHGCRVIQIDEPAAGTHPDEADLVAEGFNAATEGLDATFSMHICFSRLPVALPGAPRGEAVPAVGVGVREPGHRGAGRLRDPPDVRRVQATPARSGSGSSTSTAPRSRAPSGSPTGSAGPRRSSATRRGSG